LDSEMEKEGSGLELGKRLVIMTRIPNLSKQFTHLFLFESIFIANPSNPQK
jgi:hypothetical protein